MNRRKATLLLVASVTLPSTAFQPTITRVSTRFPDVRLLAEEWNGQIASNTDDGIIKGCTIKSIQETEFTVRIDGTQADLGKFSLAVYKKITGDAKRQRFQGFQPGTIPPHLLPTYKAFAMDEVAREAVFEAMMQNEIRPFESARGEIVIGEVAIPPRKRKGKKSKMDGDGVAGETNDWVLFEGMKDALKAGWEPGETFSFVATNCRGQKLRQVDTAASPSLASLKD